jgi:hypothetical protein
MLALSYGRAFGVQGICRQHDNFTLLPIIRIDMFSPLFMKKSLHIALIFLVVFNSAGYLFTYWQLKKIFKQTALKQTEQSIPDSQLQLIVTDLQGSPVDSQNCIRENKKEFRYYGEMYDIVRSENKGNFINHYCLKDDNENRLEAAFITFVEGNSDIPAGTLPVKNLLKYFSSDWENKENNIFFFTEEENILISGNESALLEFQSVPVPPPKIISC